ncbi:MAG: DUF92 domain-containing protein [Spirochaetaceae bacterium]|nr:MAG: DUF92 domain-containing protein [Spirochaetaceae bacterium]
MTWAILIPAAVALNGAAAIAALLHGSVSRDGAIAGFFVGATIMLAGGFVFWIMLMVFFVSSSLASRIGPARKRDLERMHEKGSQRDAIQVLSNGGAAALSLVAYRITGSTAFVVAAGAALAAATADTWASELGVLSGRAPRSVLTWRRLDPGTSGGVSLLGTFASLVGSATIALWLGVGFLLMPAGPIWSGQARLAGYLFDAIGYTFIAGFVACLVDSVMGATVQAQYRMADGSITERGASATDASGAAAPVLTRGLRWVTNDVVNAVTTFGAAAAVAVGWALAQ